MSYFSTIKLQVTWINFYKSCDQQSNESLVKYINLKSNFHYQFQC